MVNDRGVHLEHSDRSEISRSKEAFPAEIVVALDNDIGSQRASTANHVAGAKQPQPAIAQWR